MANWKDRIRQKQQTDHKRAVHNFLPNSLPSLNKKDLEPENLNEQTEGYLKEKTDNKLNAKEQVKENIRKNLNEKRKVKNEETENTKYQETVEESDKTKEQVSDSLQTEDELIHNLNFIVTHRRQQPSFEEIYKRKTFAIERQLLERFNKHMDRFPKGEQTKIINDLLRQYVDWLDKQIK